MDFKEDIINALNKILKREIVLEIPPAPEMGDYAFPCFALSKEMKKSPAEVAKDIAGKLKIKGMERIEAKGPYVNFFVSKKDLMKETLLSISKEKDKYGAENIGKNKTVVIDYSSPNIAKPFGIAHIRSTVIGNALYKIHKALGFKAVRVNHLGDWGTQFGKLIVAYNNWGDEKLLEKQGINYLVELYVKFGEEAEIDPNLDAEARRWFKELEDGNKDAIALWELFRELSIEEFKEYYRRLNIDFDSYSGEAFYNDKIEPAIKYVQSLTKTEISDGALVVDLSKHKIPPFMLRKSDGASTYHARDLAAALYRIKQYKPDKIIYVVGAPQTLHFQQLFTVLDMIGENKDRFVHIPFGNMTYEGSMMSTRTGNFILLEEVLDKAVELALKKINEKNPGLKNKKEVSEQVGIGAIIFSDLMNDRIRDVDFSWDRALDFEGETAPYLQYTHARIASIIRKSQEDKISAKIDFSLLDEEKEVIRKLSMFNDAIMQAYSNYKPHIIARYLLDLAQTFNSYYQNVQVLTEDADVKMARLFVISCVKQVLKNGLNLLGIEAPEEM